MIWQKLAQRDHICVRLLLTAVGMILYTICQSQGAEEPVPPFAAMSDEVEQNHGKISATVFDARVATFSTLVAQSDFSVSETVSLSIDDATRIAEAILASSDLHQIKPTALAALEAYFAKISAAFDSNWTPLPARMNVSPAPGTPNAAAGMDPDAIDDRQLKQQYLDLIAANRLNMYKNVQQRQLRRSRVSFLELVVGIAVRYGQGLHKAGILARFGKDAASKEILEAEFKKNGK